MESSIYKYLFRHSMRQQMTLLAMTAVSMPFIYFSLDLPKQIINDAIAADVTEFPLEFLGVQWDQISYLFVLCGIFLVLVIITGAF